MQAEDNQAGVFEYIPDYGFTVNAKGVILRYTYQVKNITDEVNELAGARVQTLFSALKRKSIVRLHDFEFNHSVKNHIIRFRVVVKLVESKKNEKYVVWLKDITNEYRQERINKTLLNISQVESESDNIDQFYRTIQDELNNLFDANNLYVVLFDKFRINLNLAFISDTHKILQPFPRGNTVALWIAQTGKAKILNQQQIKRLQKKYKLEFYGPQAQCWMGVPLKINNNVIGVIAVQSYERADAFNSEDLEILKFISSQIATSIQHKANEQELLIAKEKAEEADKLKSAFLANMSHEIRTPMNAILGFSELISRKNVLPEKKEIYTQHIVSNGKLLLTLVDDIIDLAKIEAGQLKFKRNTTNIDELLTELMHFCLTEKKRLKRDELQIEVKSGADVKPQWLLCDSFRLKQVLLNLLSNAMKFTFNGSIEFGYEIPNNATIQFFVKDSGIGILPEQQSLIFDRFRQADDSATRQFGGTGLGLSISKKLVELMGGRIWVSSMLNHGSCFYFTLPLIIPDIGYNTQPAMLNQNPSIQFAQNVALIVEDNEANYIYLYELLKPTGLNILRASNGFEAVDFIRRNPNVDLILMDLQLPELDGFEATKKIKLISPSIPIIAQTAYALAEEKNRAINAGCDYYLTKPISADSLLNLIGLVLSKS